MSGEYTVSKTVRRCTFLICRKFKYLQELIKYLHEKSFFNTPFFILRQYYLEVRVDGIERDFAREVIDPWLNEWAERYQRKDCFPSVNTYVGCVVVIVPLHASEINYVQEIETRVKGLHNPFMDEVTFITVSADW